MEDNAPVWFITGSSRGFGAAYVKTALAHGCRVVATARKVEALDEAFGVHDNLMTLPLDVTDEESVQDAVHSVIDTWGRIDVLVNNAGYGVFGALEETSMEEIRGIFETNVFGLIRVTKAILPYMRNQGFGRIVNMGSMGSYVCDPGGAPYDATKHAVSAISEAINLDMKPFGVESMVVMPGMFRTDFFDSTSIKLPKNPMTEYDGTPARGAAEYCLANNHLQYGDPMKAAEFIYEVVTDAAPMPMWLPVGADSFKKFQKVMQRKIDTVQPYKERGSQLSFEE